MNNTWREVIALSSTLYTEITAVFVKTLRTFDSWIVTRLNKLEGGELLTSDLLVFEENLTVCLSRNTAKRTQAAANLLVDDKSVSSVQQTCFCKFIVKTCYPQACWRLFQQVANLQITSCNEPEFYTRV